MAQVELRDVLKRFDDQDSVTLTGYKGRPALDHVELSVQDGETLAIVGPSGCGKSTLLKVVAGLEHPQGGQVIYDGRDFTQVKPQDRGVGFVFQDYALYPTRKGEGNLKYFFEVRKRSPEEQERKVRETAELMGVGFETLLGQTSGTLSGGEQQRVAIARCIVRDPTLFLMDEPIVNLDAKLRERTRIEMKRLLRKFEVTTLYVTHDQQEAVFMGDRICVMREGKVEQIGTFDELYYTPANAFVATFIGAPAMSLLPAQVEDRALVLSGVRFELPTDLADKVAPGDVRLGVRPEGWQLGAAGGAQVQVRAIERLPTEQASYLHGQLGGQSVSVLAPLDQAQAAAVSVAPAWDKAYLFAPQGEGVLHTPGAPEELF